MNVHLHAFFGQLSRRLGGGGFGQFNRPLSRLVAGHFQRGFLGIGQFAVPGRIDVAVEEHRKERRHGDVVLNFIIFARIGGRDIGQPRIDDAGAQRLIDLATRHRRWRRPKGDQTGIDQRIDAADFDALEIGGLDQRGALRREGRHAGGKEPDGVLNAFFQQLGIEEGGRRRAGPFGEQVLVGHRIGLQGDIHGGHGLAPLEVDRKGAFDIALGDGGDILLGAA